ncbi:MAG: hypothetical protein KC466_04650 [Myxococcales bacterium]|nr:hypothetical protein [Myxococcales bacterium]
MRNLGRRPAGGTTRWTIRLIAALFLNGASAAWADVAALRAQAVEAWETRGTREGTQATIDRLEALVRERPEDLEAQAWLARAYYWLGEIFEENEDRQIDLFERGAAHGEAALDRSADFVPALYWTGVCHAARADLSGLFQKVRFILKAKRLEQKVIDRDPTYFHGGAHLFWGSFNVKGDGIAGGRFEDSYAEFERAIEIEPDYLRSSYLFARWTLLGETRKSKEKRAADRERAREMLLRVLRTPATALPDAVPENEVAQRLSRKLYEDTFGSVPTAVSP